MRYAWQRESDTQNSSQSGLHDHLACSAPGAGATDSLARRVSTTDSQDALSRVATSTANPLLGAPAVHARATATGSLRMVVSATVRATRSGACTTERSNCAAP